MLATAHPAKFPETLERVLGPGQVIIPERLACLADKTKCAIPMAADTAAFYTWLRQLP